MSNIIAREAQGLTQDAIVTLFELDCRRYGEGFLRFTLEPVAGGAAMFNGYAYQPMQIKAEGFAWNGQGAAARPMLTVTAMDLAFLSLVIGADDLVGVPVVRRRTYRKHLDDGSDPDPEALFPEDHYVIERKQAHNRMTITFELSVEADQEGRKIPARQVLRTCTHRYRWWDGSRYRYEEATCPYAGDGEWDASGHPTERGGDRCGKQLGDCRLRFGQHSVLPTRAFPGVGKV
ncbi:phage minor tail protein L [Vreelandella malpeensis]|uniref:Phage minor tail protein L n=1 Tax=Vreelandella malpeensis TaxID=1172368 RepID=A0ABS8DUB2_9GAMM|nr:phage minor tail protein L [Halomonas malpeensis]MCB8889923.1 phage minor tail protein L [Halomonas malpeensis]